MPDFDRLNMKTFWKCFQEGEINKSNFSKSNLAYKNYSGKHYYDRIPRCIRCNITETHFRAMDFQFDDFYEYQTDENLITKEYCQVFLSMFPNHKKTNKIIKEMKVSNPELFI